MSERTSLNDQRRDARHACDFRTLGESRRRGEFPVRLANISLQGFMTRDGGEMLPGERIVVRLPKIGRIEAHVKWYAQGRAGFQFERIIRFDDFPIMLKQIGAGLPLARCA